MSAQSGKKKRLGSRRRGGKQSETSESEELHVKDCAPVAQPNLAEENTESLNIPSNPESSLLETKQPSSPELKGNRRKLGSCRRSKEGVHAEDSGTEPFDKPREEIEVNKNNGTPEKILMSLAVQPEKPNEIVQGNDHDVVSLHNVSPYSVTMSAYSSEADAECLIPMNKNLQAEHDHRETGCKLASESYKIVEVVPEGMDKLGGAQVCDQVKENACVGTSEFIHSRSALDQLIDEPQSKEMSTEGFSVNSVIETENKKMANDKDFLWLDESLESNYLVRESYLKPEETAFATTPELTTDKISHKENTEVEFSVEQVILPTEELFTNEEQNDQEVTNAQEVKELEMQEIDEIDYSFGNDSTEKSATCSEYPIQQTEIRARHQSDLSVENSDISAAKQGILNPDEKHDELPIKESNTESLDERNEDHHKEQWISKIAPCLVHEGESQVEDAVSSGEERRYFLQTLQSEVNAPLDEFGSANEKTANPTDNEDQHPTLESNTESLDQRHDEDPVSNSSEPWISSIAPCLLYEGEDQVENDTKLTAEETVHQVKDETLSEVEKSKSSLQILQSEIKVPMDSQPQDYSVSGEEPIDSSFNSIGNRRKMGSSRRNKGRKYIQESAAESYHTPTEEAVDDMRGSEAFQTSKMSLATEAIWQQELYQEIQPEMTDNDSLSAATTPGYFSEIQNLTTANHPETALKDLTPKDETLQADSDEGETDCTVVSELSEPVDAMLEETDTSNSPQIEHISDQVKETSHLVGISALTSISVHSSSPVDQQLNDPSNYRDKSNEFPSLEGRDDETNLSRQDGNESHEKPEDMKFPSTPEIASYKSSIGENTAIEFSVEQATISSSAEELPTNEELNERFILSEVKEAQHADDAENEEHKHKVGETKLQEIQQTNLSSESVIHGATENVDIHTENLRDQTEIRVTFQPDLSVKGANDSVTTQEIANCDNKQDEYPTIESNIESLDQRHDEDPVSNSSEPWISSIAPCLLYEGEDQVENDTKLTAEETVHQVKDETFSEVEKSKYSLQILQSEIKVPMDSQPQDYSVSGEEPIDSSFTPIGNRRKMGSSRRNKGRQHIQDPVTESYLTPTEEAVGNFNYDHGVEKSLIIRATTVKAKSVEIVLEEMDKIEFSTSAKTTTVKNSDGKNNENIYRIEKEMVSSPTRKLEEELNEQFKNADFRSAQQSVHEQEVKPTQMHKMDEIDYSSVKDGESSSHDQQSGIHDPLDFQHQDDSVSIKAQTHRGFDPPVIRRKMGSSRRHKGRQLVKEDEDEAFETRKISSATETTREFKEQRDPPGLKLAEDITRICPTVYIEDNTKNMQKGDAILSENVDNREIVTTDMTSSSDKDDAVKSKKEVHEKEDPGIKVEDSGISNADDACKSQQETQENSDNSENLQIKSKQKRRKLASTRRTLYKEQDGGTDNTNKTEERKLNTESMIGNLGKAEPMVAGNVSQRENIQVSLNMADEKQEVNETHVQETNILGTDEFMFLPEQSASFSEEVVNAIKCFQVSDAQGSERKEVFSVETSPIDNVTSTATTQCDNKGPKAIQQIQDQYPNEPQSKDTDANSEIKNSSPHLNLTTGRKMGSTRRNLGAISEGEDLHQKQEVDNEAMETKETELHLEKKHSGNDLEAGKENDFEKVEQSHICDSFTKPPGPQVDEGAVDHLSPNYISVKLATSPKHHALSKHGGRKKKIGSSRRSLAHPTAKEEIEKIEIRDAETIAEERGTKTLEEHREKSLGLDKNSEVVESDKKPSSDNSISKTGGHSRPVSGETPVQCRDAGVRLGQESQTSLSLAKNTKGTDSFDVVMVGNSNVGKTSFMRRAKSGKFSFDLPSSIGLDSCLWTVVVDGKPVVLKLWDTAGQERFHSITRQIFHKAQAFLLMYDITSSQSFSAVRYWASCIQEGAMEDTTILLLGNKSDNAERQVGTQEGEILAKEYNIDFIECSAATGENVVESLEIVARLLRQKFAAVEEEASLVLHKEPQHKKASGCC